MKGGREVREDSHVRKLQVASLSEQACQKPQGTYVHLLELREMQTHTYDQHRSGLQRFQLLVDWGARDTQVEAD